jgi:hypothetical protein
VQHIFLLLCPAPKSVQQVLTSVQHIFLPLCPAPRSVQQVLTGVQHVATSCKEILTRYPRYPPFSINNRTNQTINK